MKGKNLKIFIVSLAIGVLSALSFNLFFSVVVIDGESMAPTFHNKDISVIYRTDPLKGKIIVFTPPSKWMVPNHSATYIKRVVGAPGDLIEIKNSTLYVNDVQANYTLRNPSPQSYVLKKDEYFVIGDNHEHSFDSLYMLQQGSLIQDTVVKTKNVKFAGDAIWKRK